MRALLLPLLLLADPAAAQTLIQARPQVVLEEPVLRLGDVFEGAGPQTARPIGTAPAPGQRLVLEAAQLQALARAHGLAWRPASPYERVVLERPGRALAREEIEAVLRGELLRLGLDPEAELELGPLASPMVPPGAPPRLGLEGAGFDLATGRFAATLSVLAEGMAPLRLRLASRAVATAPALAATRRLLPGEVIRPGDLRPLRLRAERLRPGLAERPDQVIGQQLHRAVAAGAPLALADLGPPTLIEKNALVTMLVEAPGLSLAAQGRALEAAPRGGLVPVMNLASRSVVEGEVVGPGRVRVAMGATPLRAP
ncbi:flagellar basal body P-ring formation protein FlgA [Belnapia sp. T6]|uniref:Flagellar basal body P-ring formation protein FlgA n=1 Tax=Belnapia mucosa TaxID=2804532 RepID=A0ABS1UXB2_9PROT|nr:flagellar basal body P-ring formation chaperone FlgA [Belnapia mucosa]MBL6454109.1 flagellar basal body P-ring formation protein FlgA [Belnapia mucosa]